MTPLGPALAVALLLMARIASAATEPPRRAAPPLKAEASAPKPDGRLDLAYGAYQRGYYLTAYREATARLDKNPADVAAMTLIAELFNQGLGVRQNSAEAARWYRLAADRGEPRAMATLGLMALDGRGMARDVEAGRSWLERAAAQREPTAAYNLALALLQSGSDDDIAQAARLLVIAAEAEIGDAQHALGVMHSRGQGGVALDSQEAARLYLRAARNGSLAGEVEFAIAQFNGDGLQKDERAAARHFRFAAARGNAIAQNRLARLYLTGRGVPRNLVEAAAWHLAAKSQGLPDATLEDGLRDLSAADRTRAEQLAADRTGAT